MEIIFLYDNAKIGSIRDIDTLNVSEMRHALLTSLFYATECSKHLLGTTEEAVKSTAEIPNLKNWKKKKLCLNIDSNKLVKRFQNKRILVTILMLS